MPTPKKNIIGEVYGRLHIVGENREKTYLRAVCECECGNTVMIPYSRLVNGVKTSCGCLDKELKEKKKEEKERERLAKKKERESDPNFNGVKYRSSRVSVGDVYGHLTAVEKLGARTWLWRCSCGNERVANEDPVLSGKLKSCGCLKYRQFTDLNSTDIPVGSMSHTLEFTGGTCSAFSGDKSKRMYKCRCTQCGKEEWYEKRMVKMGYAKCDCERLYERRRHFILLLKKYAVTKFPQRDFTPLSEGQRFGKLTVIKRTENPPNETELVWYDCRCDCGNVVTVRKKTLLNGMTRSCGCLMDETYKSKREYPAWVRDVLIDPLEIARLASKDINLYSDEVTLKCSVCGAVHKRLLKYIIENDYRIPVCKECNRRTSVFEETVAEYIHSLCKSHGIEMKRHVRGIIGTQEYDIYIPSMKLAIECNGDYWHSEKVHTDSKYHYNKWEDSINAGVRLVQVFQTDWSRSEDKWKRFFDDLILPHKKVFARNLNIRQVYNKEAHVFYNENHMQGLSSVLNAGITYALEDKNDKTVYCMMSFSRLKFQEDSILDGSYELLRFAVLHGHSVIGGASRLLKTFVREFSPKEIISYSDCDLFSGKMYSELGFTSDGFSIPYYYTDGKNSVVKREQAQTTKLKAQYPELFEEAIKENAKSKERYVMNRLGYFRVNRAGNLRWILALSDDVKKRMSKYRSKAGFHTGGIECRPQKETKKSHFTNNDEMLFIGTAAGYDICVMLDGLDVPHVCLCSEDTKDVVTKVELTNDLPSKVQELKFIDGALNEEEKHGILEWASRMEYGMTVWSLCKISWSTFVSKSLSL